jgi:hypothetical protein
MTGGRSMPGDEEVIVYFESVTGAIMAEQALAGAGFSVRVMPTPSGIKAGCGFCLRFLPDDIGGAARFLSERGLAVTEAYMREESCGGSSYRRVPL